MKEFMMTDYNKLEKQEAEKDGAKLVKNSGRGLVKGDAFLGEFLVDYKFNSKTFSLTAKNWKKHRDDAIRENLKEPLIAVLFEDKTKVAILDWEMFKELREKAFKYDQKIYL